MSGEMKFEIKMPYLWHRIKGPSVTGLCPPGAPAQRPESHFTTSIPVFYLEIHLLNQNIFWLGVLTNRKLCLIPDTL